MSKTLIHTGTDFRNGSVCREHHMNTTIQIPMWLNHLHEDGYLKPWSYLNPRPWVLIPAGIAWLDMQNKLIFGKYVAI